MVTRRLLLALVLCVTGVQFDRAPLDAVAPDASGPGLSSPPVTAGAHLVRSKVDKTFAVDALAPPASALLARPGLAFALVATRAPQPPSLSLTAPPLAPRPPPAA